MTNTQTKNWDSLATKTENNNTTKSKNTATPPGVLAFHSLEKRHSFVKDVEGVFSATLIFSNQHVTGFRDFLKSYISTNTNYSESKTQEVLSKLIKDGNRYLEDRKETGKPIDGGYEMFKDRTFIVAKNKFTAPKIFDTNRGTMGEHDLTSGNIVRFSVTPYAWSFQGKSGMSLNLIAVQYLSEGKELSFSSDGKESFKATSFNSQLLEMEKEIDGFNS